MRHEMMSNAWKHVFFLLIFHKIMETQSSIVSFLALVEVMQKFYLTPTSFIVFDRYDLDMRMQKILFDVLKDKSKRSFMSQAITYDDLERLPNRSENSLYALLILDREDLEHAINITKDTDMSMHPWLLYIAKAVKFNCDRPDENFFNVRIDTWMSTICEGDTVLKSYNQIFDNQTEVVDLAIWSPEKSKLEFKNERNLVRVYMDLKGITLKVAAKVNRSVLDNSDNANIANFNYELIDEIANWSNFKTEVVAINNALGYIDHETNKWYGLMKIMEKKVADIGVALFTMAHTRMKVVDYTIPLAKGRCNVYAKLPDDTDVPWNTYFKVFNKNAWTAIGVSIFIFSILIFLMKNGFQRTSTHSFFEHFINTWGIFSMQGSSGNSSNTSIKIAYFSILFSSLILNAIYGASITSYITALSPELPFSNYDEFLRNNNYDLVVVRGSRDQSLIISNYSRLSPFRRRLKEEHLLPSYSYRGFQHACRDKTAFYTDEVKYKSLQNLLPCKLGAVFMERVEYMSFVVTKNSPYKNVINYHILRLTDCGILKRLRDKYFEKYVELPNLSPSVITLNEVWSILMIWVFGLIMTMICFLAEIIVFHYSFRLDFMRRIRNLSLRNCNCNRTIVNGTSLGKMRLPMRISP